jgi:PAS domain-containing protein
MRTAIPEERRVLGGEGNMAASLLLDAQGMIRDCDGRGDALFGYTLRELVCTHVSKLLPRLRGIELVQDGVLNPQLDHLCHCGHVFRVRGRHGGVFPSELIFVRLGDVGARTLRLFILPAVGASC